VHPLRQPRTLCLPSLLSVAAVFIPDNTGNCWPEKTLKFTGSEASGALQGLGISLIGISTHFRMVSVQCPDQSVHGLKDTKNCKAKPELLLEYHHNLTYHVPTF